MCNVQQYNLLCSHLLFQAYFITPLRLCCAATFLDRQEVIPAACTQCPQTKAAKHTTTRLFLTPAELLPWCWTACGREARLWRLWMINGDEKQENTVVCAVCAGRQTNPTAAPSYVMIFLRTRQTTADRHAGRDTSTTGERFSEARQEYTGTLGTADTQKQIGSKSVCLQPPNQYAETRDRPWGEH